jgi:triacylglycerol lipase
MIIAFLIVLIPLIYCIITLAISSTIDSFQFKKGFVFPFYSLLLESFLQYGVFFFLLVDSFRKWESYRSPINNKIAILLPGYMETQLIYMKIMKHLRKNEIGYKCIRYKPFTGDLKNLAENLKILIDLIVEENKQSEIYLIGHSMGGLIGRYFLETYEYKNIHSLIMIATPHKGTIMAKFGIGKCSEQMTPGSNFIRNLSNNFIEDSINFYSIADSLICPRNNALYLKNNHKIESHPLHNSTVFSMSAIKIIIDKIVYGKDFTSDT